ncbi:MAG: hypothetical protein ACREC9_11410 [Methylocella sp.]
MQPDDLWVSIVVDTVDDHLYKADLLIRTLDRHASIPPGQVIVHYVNRVPATSVATFARMGCKTRKIAPFLDGIYCNKLQQLSVVEEFGLSEPAGLLLLDVDIAVTAPLVIPDRDRVAGKIVDAPNPPIHVLTRIFEAAAVALPEQVQCDWNTGMTFASNFNGGVLYIPTRHAGAIGKSWKYFASFLFENPSLFENDQQMQHHMDQVSFALAIGATGAAYSHLPANSNFPTHGNTMPRTFDARSRIQMLHYHWELDDFGFLRSALKVGAVQTAISVANECAVTSSNIHFYERFKIGRASRQICDDGRHPEVPVAREILDWLENAELAPKLAFHAGTTKTGTTALQYCLEENKTRLAQRGIYYPPIPHATPCPPKHQFLVEQMMAGDAQGLGTSVLSALRAMPSNTNLIVFSTEGLFNHWWDFPAKSRSMLRFLASTFRLEVLICFRDVVEFAVSFYCQSVRNPPIHPCYGRDLSLEEMLQDEWFRRHLDYVGFLMEVRHSLGDVTIRAFDYSDSVISEILQYLGAGDLECGGERHNESLHRQGLEMIRIVNRYHLELGIREEMLCRIREIEVVFGEQLETYRPSAEMAGSIRRLTEKNQLLLAQLLKNSQI